MLDTCQKYRSIPHFLNNMSHNKAKWTWIFCIKTEIIPHSIDQALHHYFSSGCFPIAVKNQPILSLLLVIFNILCFMGRFLPLHCFPAIQQIKGLPRNKPPLLSNQSSTGIADVTSLEQKGHLYSISVPYIPGNIMYNCIYCACVCAHGCVLRPIGCGQY